MEEIVIPVKTKDGKIERVTIKPEVFVSKTILPAKLPASLPKPAPLPVPKLPQPPPPLPTPPTISRDDVLAPIVAAVIAESKVAVTPELQSRLADGVTRRFKDLYDNSELLEFLTKSIVNGGLGMLSAEARKLVGIAGSRVSQITEEMRRIELAKTRAAMKKEAEFKEMRSQIREDRDQEERAIIYESVTGKTPSPTSYQLPATSSTASSTKPKVQDVVPPSPKPIGPIEELKTMTITDFRKLARDAVTACQKIKEKIETVATDAYDRRALAINAWRESEPMRLYGAEVGAKLMGGEKPANGLTDSEFNAIMELNRVLRF